MLVIMTAAHLTKVIAECAASVKKLLQPDLIVMQSYILNFNLKMTKKSHKNNDYYLKQMKSKFYCISISYEVILL